MSQVQREDLGQINPYAAPAVDDGALWNPAASGPGVGGDGLRSYPLASRWHRWTAKLVDQTLAGLAMIPGVMVLLALVYVDRVRMLGLKLFDRVFYNDGLLLVSLSLFGLISLGPFLLFQFHLLVTRGASIGKRMVGIRVVRTSGAPLTWRRVVFLREVIPLAVNAIPFGGFLILLDALFILGNNRTCLHDLMADTRVISVGQSPEDWTPGAIAASRWIGTEI